jgi:hypothetical protein
MDISMDVDHLIDSPDRSLTNFIDLDLSGILNDLNDSLTQESLLPTYVLIDNNESAEYHYERAMADQGNRMSPISHSIDSDALNILQYQNPNDIFHSSFCICSINYFKEVIFEKKMCEFNSHDILPCALLGRQKRVRFFEIVEYLEGPLSHLIQGYIHPMTISGVLTALVSMGVFQIPIYQGMERDPEVYIIKILLEHPLIGRCDDDADFPFLYLIRR